MRKLIIALSSLLWLSRASRLSRHVFLRPDNAGTRSLRVLANTFAGFQSMSAFVSQHPRRQLPDRVPLVPKSMHSKAGFRRALQPSISNVNVFAGKAKVARNIAKNMKAASVSMSEHEASPDEVAKKYHIRAPIVLPRGLPGSGMLALGALELKADGVFWLHAQIFEATGKHWRPVLLKRTAPEVWQSGDLSLELSLAEITAAIELPGMKVSDAAPSWPRDLLRDLEVWPLKGPGTVIMDPDYFSQRGPAIALSGEGPVLFPRGAQRLGLPTEALSQQMADHLQDKHVRQVLCGEHDAKTFGDMLDRMPQGVAASRPHFDLARASSAPAGDKDAEESRFRFNVTLKEGLDGFWTETRTWSRGAVIYGVHPGSEAERLGCRVGDIVYQINGIDVAQIPVDDVAVLLETSKPLHLGLGRPKLSDAIYLREARATEAVLSTFTGCMSSAADLIPGLTAQLRDSNLVWRERIPMFFAGDGGTSSHIHIDQLKLLQFCHILHGTKLFCVASAGDREAGPVKPWLTTDAHGEAASEETVLSTVDPLPRGAEAWLQRSDVSVALVRPGDVLLFQGRSIHAGCNGLGDLCVALFHGAMSIRDMANGMFGPGAQQFAVQQLTQREP